jgi:hypothetical protein
VTDIAAEATAPETGAPEATTSTTAAAETPAAQQASLDPGVVDMLTERFASMLAPIQERLPEPAAPVAPEPADPYADYDPEDREALQGLLGPLIEHHLNPVMQRNEQLERQLRALTNDLDAGDVEQRWPALTNPEVGQRATADAVKLAQSLGIEVQDVRDVPAALIETAYLAGLGRERAATETPASGGNPELERAGGATPPEPEPDIAREIVNASGPKVPGGDFWGFNR